MATDLRATFVPRRIDPEEHYASLGFVNSEIIYIRQARRLTKWNNVKIGI